MTPATATWQPLRDELARWRDAGASPKLWLRDDDAIEPSPALDRLAGLARTYDIPILLAVIPARAKDSLREVFAAEPQLAGAVHGLAHLNHALAGAKTSEFPDSRSTGLLRADLATGRDRIAALLGPSAAHVFVPPWNRIGAEGQRLLASLGFSLLSTFGPEPTALAAPGVALVNAHVDIIDWKGTRGGRDPAWLAREIATQLAAARATGRCHVGILTHHLAHDEIAWDFLLALFEETSASQYVSWTGIRELTTG